MVSCMSPVDGLVHVYENVKLAQSWVSVNGWLFNNKYCAFQIAPIMNAALQCYIWTVFSFSSINVCFLGC